MSNLNLISLNARGLNVPHKRTTILGFLRKRNVDIAMIQESHLLRKDTSRFANGFYHPIAFSSALTKTKGVMIVCRRKLKLDLIDTWADEEGRLAIAKVKIEGQSIALISAYAPNTYEADFYSLLTNILQDFTGFRLILGADLNMIWDSNMDKTGSGGNRDQQLSSRALRQWAAQASVIDIWRMLNPSVTD